MNDDIRPLPNGDFEVIKKGMKDIKDMESLIKEAMMIPAPDCPLCEMGVPLSPPRRVINLDDFEKHLPGIQERDFSMMMSAPPGIADDMPDYDLSWAIVKLNEGKEYFLKKMNEDGTREWTRDNTVCRFWPTEKEATQFASNHFEPGTSGVRGLLTGG